MKQRVQKLLADYGIDSRRGIERLIKEGRLRINGEVAQLGAQADNKDKIQIDGKVIKLYNKTQEVPRVIMYHKPAGQVCSKEPTERNKSVFDFLPKLKTSRWVMVGRLDISTSGLLLFTTSGELANKLMHPSSEIEREYACRVFGNITQAKIQNIMKGVEVDGEFLKIDAIRDAGGDGGNHWYHVRLHTGKNREVRRLWESQAVTVSRLIRVAYGPIALPPRLRVGKCQDLTKEEIEVLFK